MHHLEDCGNSVGVISAYDKDIDRIHILLALQAGEIVGRDYLKITNQGCCIGSDVMH